jgi:hypothetical protein
MAARSGKCLLGRIPGIAVGKTKLCRRVKALDDVVVDDFKLDKARTDQLVNRGHGGGAF